VRGRHPDVDDGQLRLVLGHRLEQLRGVRHGRDDLEAAVGEHPGEPVPQQHRVLGDHDSHGSSAVMVGRPAGRAVDAQRAIHRGGPLRQPAQAGAVAAAGVGAAAARRR
jgi:hypothetical protein